MKPFRSSSYQSQVQRLRALANEALKRYSIRASQIQFMTHGENTTFRVIDSRKKSYLLRVHRADYHTPLAIREELAWLEHLAQTDIVAPSPLRSREGRLLEIVENRGVDIARPVDLLHWVDGRFVWKNVRPLHMKKIGRLLADLQTDARKRRVKHRRYWTPEGLLGRQPTFGSVYRLSRVTVKQQHQVSGAARDLLSEFRRYEKSAPSKMGLIHADLHFGNMVFRKDGEVSPIDFDDCGFGFYMHDLAVVIANIEYLVTELKMPIDLNRYEDALFEGYTEKLAVDARDREMIRLFMIGRRIMMLGWLDQRVDNPRLASRFAGALERALKSIATI